MKSNFILIIIPNIDKPTLWNYMFVIKVNEWGPQTTFVHIEAKLGQEHLLTNGWCDEAKIKLHLTHYYNPRNSVRGLFISCTDIQCKDNSFVCWVNKLWHM